MTDSGKLRHLVAAALAAASLSACSTSDDQMGRLLVAPGKFVLYSCAQLAERATAVAARQKVLLGLMEKAGQRADGRLVSSIAYRPEYLGLRGDMNELRNAAAAKNCKFVPGVENSGAHASDNAVR